MPSLVGSFSWAFASAVAAENEPTVRLEAAVQMKGCERKSNRPSILELKVEETEVRDSP